MKTCTRCERELPDNDFYGHPECAGGRRPVCKDCHREACKANRQRINTLRVELRAGLKCERCYFDDPRTLDFHHRDPATKTAEISRMITNGCGRERIEAEIAKCVVLCANCHRIIEAEKKKTPATS